MWRIQLDIKCFEGGLTKIEKCVDSNTKDTETIQYNNESFGEYVAV
jgi:hypothetical protein